MVVAIEFGVLLEETAPGRVHHVLFQSDHPTATPQDEELVEALQEFLVIGLVVPIPKMGMTSPV
jgi:hypothetical protein